MISDSISTWLMKSTDGGINWTKKFNINQWIEPIKIYFGDKNTGFLISNGYLRYDIIQTKDNGENWQIVRISYPFNGICLLDKSRGFVFGGISGWHLPGSGFIDMSSDQGQTWKWNNTFLYDPVRACFFINDFTGFILTAGSIRKTTNSGETWKINFEYNPDSTAGYYLSGMIFAF